jgi:hypothetical protein
MFDSVPLNDNNYTRGGLGISQEQFIPTLSRNNADGCYWLNDSGLPDTPPGPADGLTGTRLRYEGSPPPSGRWRDLPGGWQS